MPGTTILGASSPPRAERAAAGSKICAALLLPQDRIARAPLSIWAETLTLQLHQCREKTRRPREYASEFAGVANNAALVATHQGDLSLAWRLCTAQAWWQLRFSRRARDPEIAAHAVQPYVNLGRLEAFTGKCEAALARFAALGAYRHGEPLLIGGMKICGTGEQAVSGRSQRFGRLLKNIQVVDSLKALLLNGRHAQVLDFACSLGPDTTPRLLSFADEASVVAACALGNFGLARQIVMDAMRRARDWNRVVFRLRLAETLACAGDPAGAESVLVPLSTMLDQVSAAKRNELTSLYIMLRVSSASADVGLSEEAVQTARNVYLGARAAGDQGFEIESLRILADLDSGPDGHRWRESLAKLEETTDYIKYRRGDRKPTRNPAIDRLYEMLTETLSN